MTHANAHDRQKIETIEDAKSHALALERAIEGETRAEGGTLRQCERILRELARASDASAKEDFELIESLRGRVTRIRVDDGRQQREDAHAAAKEAIGRARRLGLGSANANANANANDVGKAYDGARARVVARVIAIVELHEHARRERIKLLADLVNASRNG